MLKIRLFFLVFLFAVFLIFHPWLDFSKSLSSGDWPYLYKENINEFQIFHSPFLWLEPYYQLTAKIGVGFLNLSWEVTEKIFWFIPITVVNVFSSFTFLKYIFNDLNVKNTSFITLGSFIYIANTYFLMVVGGGQLGVAFSYSLAPLSLFVLFKSLKERVGLRFFILSLFVLSVQLMFDPRIFLITTLAFLIYFLFLFYFKKTERQSVLRVFGALLISLALNLLWLIPNISFYKQEYTLFATEPLASFLSFASFSNTVSLLHPNWPENIFGKVGFMRPEFILLGTVPYLSLLFARSKIYIESSTILAFVSLGIIGAFLAKGVNPPFGEFYEFFSTLPGSSIFRDPTKFYILISLSYLVLIPIVADKIYSFLETKDKISVLNFHFSIKSKFLNLQSVVLVLGIAYLLFLIRPAILGQLSGTFKPQSVPEDYVQIKKFFLSRNESFNYLSVPTIQRFSFSSKEIVAISATDIFPVEDIASSPAMLAKNSARQELKELNIKYVIVPFDSRGEIFLTDRKYDESLRRKTIDTLKKIDWLMPVETESKKNEFGKIFVFQIK